MAKKGRDPAGDALGALGRGIGKALRMAGYGCRKLRSPVPIVGLCIAVCICVAATMGQDWIHGLENIAGQPVPVPVRFLLCWVLQLAPLLYLILLGSSQNKKASEYETLFEEIGFVGKDKKCPVLIDRQESGKKIRLSFKSNIPLGEWTRWKEQLETALDCNIRQIREGKSKKIVELVTIPSDCRIPEMIRWSDEFIQEEDGVMSVGQDDIEEISFDLNRVPHVLIAGETGSGKSVILRTLLWQMIYQGCRLYMFDFKGGVEFGLDYEQYGAVITERERAVEVMEMLVEENKARLTLFRSMKVKNLKQYNDKTHSNLCRIGVFIDEIAEMLDKKGVTDKKERAIFEKLEGALSTLARLSRATGINLIIGVQRPDANVLTGQIKNNIPVRISGRFADKVASEIVLGNRDACDLPDIKGRFMYKVGNTITEFQAYLFNDEEDLKEVEIEPGDVLTPAMAAQLARAVVQPDRRPAQRWEAELPEQPEPPGEPPEDANDEFDFDYEQDPWEEGEE